MSKPRTIRARAVLATVESIAAFINDELIPFMRQQQGQYVPLGAAMILSGVGPPSVSPPVFNGAAHTGTAIYLQEDGHAGTTVWVFIPSTAGWVAVI